MPAQPTLADLPIEVQEEIKSLLYHQGKYLDETDILILHMLLEPQTIPDIAPRFDLTYATVRRRCDFLVNLKLIHPVGKKGKALVYLTAASDFKSALQIPKGMVKLRGRDLTLQEFSFMLLKEGYVQSMVASISWSLIHLARRIDDIDNNREPKSPLPLSVRLMYENMLPQFIEIVTALEKLIQMPIYDDSVGARQYLGTFNEDILENWGNNFNTSWLDGTATTKGFKVNFEVAKRMYEVIEKAREALGKNKLTEEEILASE
jgi:hypothetical protein